MTQKNPLLSYIVNDPESAFNAPYLSYKSTEIESILDRFRLASYRPSNKYVKELLRATSDFRHSTVPEGLFKELRSDTKLEVELNQIFIDMSETLATTINAQYRADFSEEDKKILRTAIDYCKISIKERMASLQADDRLVPLWNASELKKQIEN